MLLRRIAVSFVFVMLLALPSTARADGPTYLFDEKSEKVAQPPIVAVRTLQEVMIPIDRQQSQGHRLVCLIWLSLNSNVV